MTCIRPLSAEAKPWPLLISVVVSTLDRAEFLDRTLTGLRQLRYGNFEIVVVRGPCTDGTDDVLERHAPAIRVGHCAEANLSMSRNVGIAMARGEIVAFIDDDAVPEPDWLDRLFSPFADSGVVAVGGYIRNPDGITFQYRVVVADRFGDAFLKTRPVYSKDRGHYLSPTGTNIAIRRDALLRVGGFDEHYAYFLDETDLNLRLADAGGQLVMDPQAEIYHKFARNQVRGADRAPRSMYPIARSKAYFCWRNALDRFGPGAVEGHLLAYRRRREAIISAALKKGRIDTETCERLISEIGRGLHDGTLAAQRRADRDLLTDGLLTAHASEAFKPYVPATPAADRMRLCFIAPASCVDDSDLWRWTRGLAVGLVARGHEVAVIYPGAGQRPSVDFVDGVWMHALAPRGFAKRGAARELARIQARRNPQIACRLRVGADGGITLSQLGLPDSSLPPGGGSAPSSSYLAAFRLAAVRRLSARYRAFTRDVSRFLRDTAEPGAPVRVASAADTAEAAVTAARDLCERLLAAALPSRSV